MVRALRSNGYITCVSAAPNYHLWRLHEHPELHLACSNGGSGDGTVVHPAVGLPRNEKLPLAPLADVLLHAVTRLPNFEALSMAQCATGGLNLR
ncbi:hypothetical protein [Paenarthrobacter sp. PH39-S1]|uniref:hypothetical protein n=1 Tax=Paenarthrobacter sp. PH39-S1 TaxID=3046204 RepID=UPI0024BB85B6|nr:hypothetical protein [Paenarthrobacter sp. PH39-S1]MDJ0355075.1 hypothetical protein [Paenarthrobacter sp. PH39-S1]